MSLVRAAANRGRTALKTVRAWVWLTASGIVIYQVLYVWWLIAKPGGDEALLWFGDTAYLIAPAAATALLFLAAQRSVDRQTRLAWSLLGAAMLMWTVGEATWSLYELVLKTEVPYPSLADLAYLAAYPFAFAGLLLFPRGPADRVRRLKLTLDTLIAMVALTTLSWYFVIGELVLSSSGPSLLASAVNVTYPLADLGLIFAVLVLIARPGPRYLNLPLALLAAGFAGMAVADSVYLFAVEVNGYATGDFTDIGWVASYNLTAYAALVTFVLSRPGADETSAEQRGSSPLRSLIPYAIATLLVVLLAATQLDDKAESFHYPVIAGCTLALILIVARQVVSIYENIGLNGALRARAVELAQRHQQLSLLYRAVSALSQALSTHGVLTLADKLVSECRGSQQVTVWEVRDGEARRWAGNPQRRSENPDVAPSPASVERVKLSASEGKPILIPENGNGAAKKARPSGDGGGRLYLSLGRKESTRHVLEVELVKAPALTADDITLIHALGMEIGIALERAQQYEAAREQADRDFLTGLYGHRALQAELERALQAASRRGEALAIVAMDTDNFRLFNDTYGHSAGDQVLKMIAEHLAGLCQDNGLAARYGGDDFMVILPKAGREAAFAFAQSVQGWLSEKHFLARGSQRIPISVSCGVAVFPEDGQKRHELVAVADANLYESKSLGGKIIGRPKIQEQKAELRKLGTFDMLESLVIAIDNKDHYTKVHSKIVTECAVMLAQEIGHSEQVQKTLRIAGIVHDVGKICIPDRVLRKPGPLTAGEYEIVKQHVVIAEHLLVDLPDAEQVREAALNHHERFDGMGYPNRLEGKQIPLLGRIMAIADAYSAMVLDRPYRKGRTVEEALAEIQRCAGTQLDPELVEAFVRMVGREEAVAELSRT